MAPRRFFTAGEKQTQRVRIDPQRVPRELHAPHQLAQRRQIADRSLPFLTVEEASIRLHISARSVYDLIRQQGLPVRRLGRLFRIDHGELEEWTRRERHDDIQRFPVIAGGRKRG